MLCASRFVPRTKLHANAQNPGYQNFFTLSLRHLPRHAMDASSAPHTPPSHPNALRAFTPTLHTYERNLSPPSIARENLLAPSSAQSHPHIVRATPLPSLSLSASLIPNAPAARNSQPPLSPHTHARSTRTQACPPVYTSPATHDANPPPSDSAPALPPSLVLLLLCLLLPVQDRSAKAAKEAGPEGRAGLHC